MDSERQKDDVWLVIYSAFIGIIGYGIYCLIRNRKTAIKIITFICSLIILTGISYFLQKSINTHYTPKLQTYKEKDWFLIKNGNLCFEYPNQFIELEDEETELSEVIGNVDVRLFIDENEEQIAVNIIYNFEDTPPKPENSLAGSIVYALETLDAYVTEWVDSEFYNNSVTTKVKYMINGKEMLGLGIIYFNGNRYEIADFLPYKNNYPEEYLDRILNSARIDLRTKNE